MWGNRDVVTSRKCPRYAVLRGILRYDDGSAKELYPMLTHHTTGNAFGLLGSLEMGDLNIPAMCADGGCKFLSLFLSDCG